MSANLNQSGSTDATANLGPLHLSPGFRYIRRSYGATGDGPKDYNVAELGEALTDHERFAYARLFAAAPDLLASIHPDGLTGDGAIADTLDQLAEQYYRHGLAILASELRMRTEMRRKAIAKAEAP